MEKFDLIIIGSGPGGLACSAKSAELGAKVAIVEYSFVGGRLGIIPKISLIKAAEIKKLINDAPQYGFNATSKVKFDWETFKKKRDASLENIVSAYEKRIPKAGIRLILGAAEFVTNDFIRVDNTMYEANHIVIASGSRQALPSIPGVEYGTCVDDAFDFVNQPKNIAIVGAGSSGVEVAGMFNLIGTHVSIFYRHSCFLPKSDAMIGESLTENYVKDGVDIFPLTEIISITQKGYLNYDVEYLNIKTGEHAVMSGFDAVIWAIGRAPRTNGLRVENTDIILDSKGFIVVNPYQETNVCRIYALGDITGISVTAPVAAQAGKTLAQRLFGNDSDAKCEYENVPTVVFAIPPAASVGLTEKEAVTKYGRKGIVVVETDFVDLYYAMLEDKRTSKYKLIYLKASERVIGIHIVGRNSDEIILGFAIAIKMGATRDDIKKCPPLHPTSSEELVNM